MADLPRVVAESLYIARTGRPGPVLIDIPMDVSIAEVDYEPVKEVKIRSYSPEQKIDDNAIDEAVKLIEASERPVIYAGGGVIISGAAEELTGLSEKTHILVTTTLLGKGAIPETHPHSLGMLGMHGTAYANHAVDKCDLLIAVGARFDDRVTGKLAAFAKKAKVIHIDVDPAEIEKTVQVDVSIIGDCKEILTRLAARLGAREETEWNRQIMQWRNEFALHCPADGSKMPPAVRDRPHLGSDQGRGDSGNGRGSAPDVHRAILQGDQAEAVPFQRRAWARWATASPLR